MKQNRKLIKRKEKLIHQIQNKKFNNFEEFIMYLIENTDVICNKAPKVIGRHFEWKE